jgi:hypothetical protein
MIGRGHEVRALKAGLSQGRHHVVGGPRRTGKTTLCQAVVARMADEGWYAVSVDLFSLTSLGELAGALVAEGTKNRPVARRALGRLRGTGRRLREAVSLAPVARLGVEVGAEVELAVAFGSRPASPEQRFGSALTFLGRLSEADGVRLVLYVDEAQELGQGTFGDPDLVTKRMRAVLQKFPSVVTLFAGSQEHLLRSLFAPRQRAFYGWASWVKLSPISEEEWVDGLRSRFERGGFSVTTTALGRLVRLSECHPRATMLLAQHSATLALSDNDGLVDDGIVEEALFSAMNGDFAFHEEVMAELRRMGKYVPRVALALARGEPPYEAAVLGEVSTSAISRSLQALNAAGVIEKRGARGRGGWVVVDPLLRRRLCVA